MSDPFIEEADHIVMTAEENAPDLVWQEGEREKLVGECAAILERAWHKVEDRVNEVMDMKGN